MNLTSFFIYCIIVTFTPGPTNILILSTSQNHGAKNAMAFSYGATLAFGLLLFISAILNSFLLEVLPKILILMQIVGSLYMLYLAYQIYRMDVSESRVTGRSTFFSGFFMQFVNPKVIMFTMTVFPGFILPFYNDPHNLKLFAGIITIIGFCAFVTWVLFGVIFRAFLQKYRKMVNIIMSLFLVYSAIMVSGIVGFIKG